MAIKGLIRRAKRKPVAATVRMPDEQMHFLDMPFYETGAVKKKPLGEEDIKIIDGPSLQNQTAPDLCRGRSFRTRTARTGYVLPPLWKPYAASKTNRG